MTPPTPLSTGVQHSTVQAVDYGILLIHNARYITSSLVWARSQWPNRQTLKVSMNPQAQNPNHSNDILISCSWPPLNSSSAQALCSRLAGLSGLTPPVPLVTGIVADESNPGRVKGEEGLSCPICG